METAPPAQSAAAVQSALSEVSDPKDAVFLQRFFKTGPGQYGAGDVFLGVRVPATRKVAARFLELPLPDLGILLDSMIANSRLAALVILVARFQRASAPRTRNDQLRGTLFDCYLDAVRRGRVNNWDLVDGSAEFLVGEYLLDRPLDLLFELAASESVWERRVAMLSTFAFTKRGRADPTLAIAEVLLEDQHDLIQKAVGWMLREVGKRVGRSLLTGFLEEHAARMPRTALSYATEHLSQEERAYYRSR